MALILVNVIDCNFLMGRHTNILSEPFVWSFYAFHCEFSYNRVHLRFVNLKNFSSILCL